MKMIFKISVFSLLFCFTVSSTAQTFDLSNSRDAYKIDEMGLSSFELYYTNIFNMYGKTYRNPTVEEETNGVVNYSERLKNQGVLKEEWRNYPVYFHGIQFEEGIKNRNLLGTNPQLTKDILAIQQSYFSNELGFQQVQDYFSITELENNSIWDGFFRPEIFNEASKVFKKDTFDTIIKEHTQQSGINVISFLLKQEANASKSFQVSTYVYLNDVLLFATILNMNLCNYDYEFEYEYDCLESYDLADFSNQKKLKPMVHTLFENIQKY